MSLSCTIYEILSLLYDYAGTQYYLLLVLSLTDYYANAILSGSCGCYMALL